MAEDRSEIIARGERARQLLDSDTYREAVAQLRQRLTDELMGTSMTQAAEREGLYHTIRGIAGIDNILTAWADAAQVERKALAAEEAQMAARQRAQRTR